MPQSLAQIYLHIVFSTKDRRPFLADADLRAQTHAYLAGIAKNQDSPCLIAGDVEDHVHLLCRLGRETTIAGLIRDLKRDSSSWIKSESRQLSDFHWQAGYGAFFVSPSHVPPLTRYIADQVEHHRTVSFQDELRQLFAKYGVEYDERYVWD